MTDIDRQSLRDFMAEKVMGWIKDAETGLYLLPVGNDSWQRMSRIEDWHPDLDSNQLDRLVDKMVEDGFELYISLSPDEVPEVDRRLAVLLAIKAAKESN